MPFTSKKPILTGKARRRTISFTEKSLAFTRQIEKRLAELGGVGTLKGERSVCQDSRHLGLDSRRGSRASHLIDMPRLASLASSQSMRPNTRIPQPRSHVDLSDGQRRLGRFDAPDVVNSGPSHQFRLGVPRKGGGNGVVFEAIHFEDGSLKRTCAVKLLRRLDAARVDRFANEVRIVKELAHENIAEYFAAGEVKIGGFEVPWMAQELGGRNLREHVNFSGKVPIALLKSIAGQMCKAVEHLHSKGFIHRDIKPDNFVWVEGSHSQVMMIDMGIAKRVNEDVSGRPMDTLTQSLEFVGPVFFSSPELIEYAKNKSTVVDFRSDVFQLGKTIWFLATGQISAGVPSRALCPLGGRLREIVLKALDDDPSMRQPSVAEFRGEIERL